jgi:hypothetical protein
MALVATLMLAAACGGGGADVGSGGTGFVDGTVTKGPVGNATVAAYGISSGQMGTQIGTATTDVNGNFRMDIGAYSGPVLLQASGGSFTDEATGTLNMPMAIGDVMTAVMPSVAAKANTSGIQVTPLTAMAQKMAQHMTGGMTETNIATANTAMGNTFTISDILHIAPMNPLVQDSGLIAGVTQDSKNYGMTLAAMSQYAQTLGLSSSSSVVTAMMNDATDGKLDGMAGSTPVRMGGMGGGMMMPPSAGTSGMGGAMNTFMNSVKNKSGAITQALVNKLNAAGGQIGGVPPVPVMNATVSGTAFNGPVSSATVMVFAINNGVMGAQIASVATDSQGNFTMPLGNYTGPVLLQMSGASYKDEATQKNVTMAPGDVMSAMLPTVVSGANVTGVWITPVTAMAQSRAVGMTGGMTDANIATANTHMGNYFSVSDILHTQPMNPLVPGAGAGATLDAKNYGMTLAAMSQYAKTLNMAVSSTLVTAMMNDASDGMMDGKKGGTAISMAMGGMMANSMMAATAGTSSLATAMTAFMMNLAVNASGLSTADMTALMLKLTNSNGQI